MIRDALRRASAPVDAPPTSPSTEHQSRPADANQPATPLYAQASGHMISYSERASRAGENDLCTRVLEVRDELLALLRLLDARKDHFRALDVLLGGQQVVEQRVFAPDDPGVFVRVREGIP